MQATFPAAFAPFAALLRSRPTAARVPRELPATAAIRALKAGATLVLPHPRGQRIECVRGSLWLTHDGDPKDVILAAGESYTAARDSRLIAYGLEASDLRIA